MVELEGSRMIVKRENLTFWERLYLPALWGGFKITASHLANTLFKGNNAAKTTSDGYYPEVPWTVAQNYRGAPYLVRDQEGKTKCVSCQLCEFVCPPKAIKITPPGPDGMAADRPNAELAGDAFGVSFLIAHEVRRAAVVLGDGPRDFGIVAVAGRLGGVVALEERVRQMTGGDLKPAK